MQSDRSDLTSFYNKVRDLPKPDVIFVNPPCETFSIATRGRYYSGKTGNLYYYEDGTPITDYYDWQTSSNVILRNLKKDKSDYFIKLKERRSLHEKLHESTEKIIKDFNVPFYYDVFTYYSAYDPEFTLKPTRIRSSLQLSLLGAPKYITKHSLKEVSDYNIKSAMPRKLIRSIVGQLLNIEFLLEGTGKYGKSLV